MNLQNGTDREAEPIQGSNNLGGNLTTCFPVVSI